MVRRLRGCKHCACTHVSFRGSYQSLVVILEEAQTGGARHDVERRPWRRRQPHVRWVDCARLLSRGFVAQFGCSLDNTRKCTARRRRSTQRRSQVLPSLISIITVGGARHTRSRLTSEVIYNLYPGFILRRLVRCAQFSSTRHVARHPGSTTLLCPAPRSSSKCQMTVHARRSHSRSSRRSQRHRPTLTAHERTLPQRVLVPSGRNRTIASAQRVPAAMMRRTLGQPHRPTACRRHGRRDGVVIPSHTSPDAARGRLVSWMRVGVHASADASGSGASGSRTRHRRPC